MVSSLDLSIVIPFYNEESVCRDVVQQVVATLEGENIEFELLLVDNGSVDKTGSILDDLAHEQDRIRVIYVPVNRGYGWGILCGLAECKGTYVGYMDGDNQVNPSEMVKVYRMAAERQLDLCKGRRITRKDGWKRQLISYVYNGLFRLLFGGAVTDINAKPKVFRHEVYTRLELDSEDWFIDAEVMIKALKMALRIGEIGVHSDLRVRGHSKVQIGAVVEFVYNLLKYRFTINGWCPEIPLDNRPKTGQIMEISD